MTGPRARFPGVALTAEAHPGNPGQAAKALISEGATKIHAKHGAAQADDFWFEAKDEENYWTLLDLLRRTVTLTVTEEG